MSIHLPPPIDLYVRIENSGDVEATYEGLAAIREWKAGTRKAVP